jgi:hypothetical protein
MEEQKNQGLKSLFVTYELALKLKEKGFDEECLTNWDINGIPHLSKYLSTSVKNSYYSKDNGFNPNVCSAPLYQQVVDWLESEKNILIDITHNYYFEGRSINTWHISITNRYGAVKMSPNDFPDFDTRQEALTKTIEQALTLI